MTKAELVAAYVRLLTPQYQSSSRLMAWLGHLVGYAADCRGCSESFDSAFDLDLAVGNSGSGGPVLLTESGERLITEDSDALLVEPSSVPNLFAPLDILGLIVGVKRELPFQPSNGVSPLLDDDTFRLLIRAKVVKNQWDGKIGTLKAAWKLLFPTGTIKIQDNQDMSLIVTMTGNFSSIIVDLINNDFIVPRPEGVLINFGFGDMPFFGFDRVDDYIAGFDQGHWT
jgi:hypothetical protein